LKLTFAPGTLTRGLEGGLDLTLSTPAVGEGRLQFDTIGGVAASGAPNVAPAPGSYQIKGTGGTTMLISDAAPAEPGAFRVRTDSNGDGAYDADVVIPFSRIFDTL
jgi:hypothetical protein